MKFNLKGKAAGSLIRDRCNQMLLTHWEDTLLFGAPTELRCVMVAKLVLVEKDLSLDTSVQCHILSPLTGEE